jgi:hypothetical protein
LWLSLVEDLAPGWRLDARDLAWLESAGRATDRVADLEDAITADGLMVLGSKGQPVLHPAVSEARMTRQLVASLVDKVAIGPPMPKTGHLSGRQRDQLRDARRARGGVGRG